MRAKGTLHGKDGKNLAVGNMAKVMCWQFCVCIYLSHLLWLFLKKFFYPCSFNFRKPGRHHLSPASQTHCKTEWGRCWWHRRWWWSDGLCAYDSVFRAVAAVSVKELLCPHFCSITPNLPLNIHTGVCEVTYGVIVRCQWTLVRTAPTWKCTVEHSEPLMVSNGIWHQCCLVSFFFFPLFLFCLRLLPSRWSLHPFLNQRFRQMKRVWKTEQVFFLSGWKTMRTFKKRCTLMTLCFWLLQTFYQLYPLNCVWNPQVPLQVDVKLFNSNEKSRMCEWWGMSRFSTGFQLGVMHRHHVIWFRGCQM